MIRATKHLRSDPTNLYMAFCLDITMDTARITPHGKANSVTPRSSFMKKYTDDTLLRS